MLSVICYAPQRFLGAISLRSYKNRDLVTFGFLGRLAHWYSIPASREGPSKRERAVSSVVEHQFHILGVVGSNPISPTLSDSDLSALARRAKEEGVTGSNPLPPNRRSLLV